MEIAEKFKKFDEKNPHVYRQLVDMTYQLKNTGHKRIGIKMLYEVLRWKSMLRTSGDDYKLSNNFHAHYARKIMDENPDLQGMFELREQNTA